MRTEKEIYALVTEVAGKDDGIRAAVLTGSRANPSARRDIFQDYDIVYFVTEIEPFTGDEGWIDVFGERMIMQKPDAMELFPTVSTGCFSFLMQFTDGNRIDLTLVPADRASEWYGKEIAVLTDKDGLFDGIPAHTKKRGTPAPSETSYADCCNEFWWVSIYAAKGLWRNELPYALWHLDERIRPCLLQMLEWEAGVRTGFPVNTGKHYRYLQRHLPDERWKALLKTYRTGSRETCWKALFLLACQFRDSSRYVAAEMGFRYPEEEDEKVSAYLRHIRRLPNDAKEIL